jgi:hypothetical protein
LPLDWRCNKQLYHPEFAWTPFYSEIVHGRAAEIDDIGYNEFLRIAYVIGTKTAADAGAHLAEVKPTKYNTFSMTIRTAMAYAEYARGLSVQFTSGVGELDGFNSNTSRAGREVPLQNGRTLGFKHRESKDFALLPRASRDAFRGHAGPEDLSDVQKPIEQKFKDGSTMGSDACRAFGGALRRIKAKDGTTVPQITARHGHKEYVRPCKISLKGASKKLRKSLLAEKAKTRRMSEKELALKRSALLKKPSRNSKQTAKQSSSKTSARKLAKDPSRSASSSSLGTVTLLGGDNCIEGLFGALTNGMSRTNLLGRRAGANAHINQLSTAWLLRKPGLESVLEALSLYRSKFQDEINPSKTYSANPWLDQAKRP